MHYIEFNIWPSYKSLFAADIVDKGVRVCVAVVGGVMFGVDGLPLAAVSKGEEGIGIHRGIVNKGNIELVC